MSWCSPFSARSSLFVLLVLQLNRTGEQLYQVKVRLTREMRSRLSWCVFAVDWYASSTSTSCTSTNPILFGSLLKFVAVCTEPRGVAQGHYRFAACAAVAVYPFEVYAVHRAPHFDKFLFLTRHTSTLDRLSHARAGGFGLRHVEVPRRFPFFFVFCRGGHTLLLVTSQRRVRRIGGWTREFTVHAFIICMFFFSRGGHIFWYVFHRFGRISYLTECTACILGVGWVWRCCSRLILWSRTEPLSGSGGAALPRSLHSYLRLGSRHWRAADEFHIGLLGVLQMPCLEHSVKLKSDLPLDC